MANIEKSLMIGVQELLSLRLNPLLRLRALWLSTQACALLSLWSERVTCSGEAQQVWKNARLPWFDLLGGLGLLGRTRLALWALRHDPEPSRALRRTRCGDAQPAKNGTGFAQGCVLSRTAKLDTLMSIFEEKASGQRLSSGPIRDDRSRRSDADGFAAGLDLDRERPCWASHERCEMSLEESSPNWVGGMILRRCAPQTCPPMRQG